MIATQPLVEVMGPLLLKANHRSCDARGFESTKAPSSFLAKSFFEWPGLQAAS